MAVRVIHLRRGIEILSTAAMVLVGTAPLPGAEFVEEFSEVVPFVAGGKVEISTIGGSVVFTGTDALEVRVEARKTVQAGNEEEGKRALSAIGIDVERSANTILIETEFPEDKKFFGRLFSGRGSEDVRVDYRILVPMKTDVHVDGTSTDVQGSAVDGMVSLDLTSGNSDLSDVGGNVLIDGTSGDVKVLKVKGDLLIDNTSGQVTATEVGGDVEIDKTSGVVALKQVGSDFFLDGTSCDVKAESVGGDAEFDLTSGDVIVTGLGGGLSHEGTSGDMHIEFSGNLDDPVAIATISGDVELVLPGDSDFTLDLETLSGGINVEISRMEISEVSSNNLKAVVGGGGVPIDVETTSGSIRITGK
jgi:DUF4097 and DUF4098 domain-containing protein YvlB